MCLRWFGLLNVRLFIMSSPLSALKAELAAAQAKEATLMKRLTISCVRVKELEARASALESAVTIGSEERAALSKELTTLRLRNADLERSTSSTSQLRSLQDKIKERDSTIAAHEHRISELQAELKRAVAEKKRIENVASTLVEYASEMMPPGSSSSSAGAGSSSSAGAAASGSAVKRGRAPTSAGAGAGAGPAVHDDDAEDPVASSGHATAPKAKRPRNAAAGSPSRAAATPLSSGAGSGAGAGAGALSSSSSSAAGAAFGFFGSGSSGGAGAASSSSAGPKTSSPGRRTPKGPPAGGGAGVGLGASSSSSGGGAGARPVGDSDDELDGIDAATAAAATGGPSSAQARPHCHLCRGQFFRTWTDAQAHQRAAHGKVPAADGSGFRGRKDTKDCPDCGRDVRPAVPNSGNAVLMKLHRATHGTTPPVLDAAACALCGKVLASKGSLVRHYQTLHPGVAAAVGPKPPQIAGVPVVGTASVGINVSSSAGRSSSSGAGVGAGAGAGAGAGRGPRAAPETGAAAASASSFACGICGTLFFSSQQRNKHERRAACDPSPDL